MVRLERVTKLFRQGRSEVRGLDGVSMDVAAGEFVTIMGPSGSGKSTLLHLIGGLDRPTSGEIYLDDAPLSRMSEDELTLLRRRRIGFIFQFFHLLPTLTVEENVSLPCLLDGKRLALVRPRVEGLLEGVGLLHRRTHRADELSGGEMQRVAIARALIIEPAILLADEPTGNLDSRTGEEVLQMMQTLVNDRGCATIMVTHDIKAAACGSRVIAMRDGCIMGETNVSPGGQSPAARQSVNQELSEWYRNVAGRGLTSVSG